MVGGLIAALLLVGLLVAGLLIAALLLIPSAAVLIAALPGLVAHIGLSLIAAGIAAVVSAVIIGLVGGIAALGTGRVTCPGTGISLLFTEGKFSFSNSVAFLLDYRFVLFGQMRFFRCNSNLSTVGLYNPAAVHSDFNQLRFAELCQRFYTL